MQTLGCTLGVSHFARITVYIEVARCCFAAFLHTSVRITDGNGFSVQLHLHPSQTTRATTTTTTTTTTKRCVTTATKTVRRKERAKRRIQRGMMTTQVVRCEAYLQPSLGFIVVPLVIEASLPLLCQCLRSNEMRRSPRYRFQEERDIGRVNSALKVFLRCPGTSLRLTEANGGGKERDSQGG